MKPLLNINLAMTRHLPLTLLCVALCACAPEESSEVESTQLAKPTTANDINHWPQLVSPIDPALESRIAGLMAEMTTEQKVAQIIQPEIRDFTVEDMRQYGFGSYLNGGGAFPNNDKNAPIRSWVELAESLYQASIDDRVDGSRIPTMWATDAVHGHNNVIGATLYPHNIALGATHNPALIKRIASATAAEVAATGIDWVFAPTVAVAQDIRWGRSYESWSSDHTLVEQYAEAFVKGMQGEGAEAFGPHHTLATLKHFVGDGGTQGGDDQGNTIADEKTLATVHGAGYFSGIAAKSQTIMASFNSWHGDKLHGHSYLLTDVLKKRLGFDGVVVGDWNGHGQLPDCSNEHCPAAFNAGLDIFMVPGDSWKALYRNTVKDVKTGAISQQRLDDAVARVLRVKLRAGLFEKPSPANRLASQTETVIGNAAHRALARQTVRESLVLLKNEKNILPLSRQQNILVCGDGADNIGKQSGGWSITWQGNDNSNADFPGATSILQGIKEVVSTGKGSVQFNVDCTFSATPTVAIMVYGEDPYAEGNGDLANLEYQRNNKRDLAILRHLKAQNIPVISVFLSGRPMWTNAEINASNAFVAAWLPGTEGAGIADVLFKDAASTVAHDFVGRLPFAWPLTPHPETDNQFLFAVHEGLSYADQRNVTILPENYSVETHGDITLPLLQGSLKGPYKMYVAHNADETAVKSNSQSVASVNVRTIDKTIQEDARLLSVTDSAIGTMLLRSDFPQDLRTHVANQNALHFAWKRSEQAPTNTFIEMRCGPQCISRIDISALIRSAPSDEWQKVEIPLSCFEGERFQFGQVFTPFALSFTGPGELSVADILVGPHTGPENRLCQFTEQP